MLSSSDVLMTDDFDMTTNERTTGSDSSDVQTLSIFSAPAKLQPHVIGDISSPPYYSNNTGAPVVVPCKSTSIHRLHLHTETTQRQLYYFCVSLLPLSSSSSYCAAACIQLHSFTSSLFNILCLILIKKSTELYPLVLSWGITFSALYIHR